MVRKRVLVDPGALDAVEVALAGQLVVDHVARLAYRGGIRIKVRQCAGKREEKCWNECNREATMTMH